MCECKKDIESRLLERFKEQSPEATDHPLALQGYGLAIMNGLVKSLPFMSAKQTATFKTAAGGVKKKAQIINMTFNFCPFCGEKIDKGGAA